MYVMLAKEDDNFLFFSRKFQKLRTKESVQKGIRKNVSLTIEPLSCCSFTHFYGGERTLKKKDILYLLTILYFMNNIDKRQFLFPGNKNNMILEKIFKN